jgi:hypothetical protein
LTFFVPGWLSQEAAREQLTAIGREIIPALLGGFAGTTESANIVAEQAARQAQLRAAMTAKAATQ